MKLININPPGQAPSLLNIDYIASIELWFDPTSGAPKGSVIRMGYLAARDDLAAPVKHATLLPVATILEKLKALGMEIAV